MSPVDDYLAQSYRKDVLGTQTEVTAPAGTPERIAEVKARIADFGGIVLPGSATDFGRLIAEETEKWGRVVKLSGAKPD